MTTRTPTSDRIDAALSLATLLERENAGLLAFDFSVSGALADAKREAIIRIETVLEDAPEPPVRDRNRMAAAWRRLDVAVTTNRTLLQQAINTQKNVIATVCRALEPADQDGSYPSHHGLESGFRNSQPVALVLRA